MKSCFIFYFIMPLMLMSTSVNADKLRFVAEELPPFHFTNMDKKPDGALVEVVKAVLAQAKLQGSIELVPFARAYSASKNIENVFMFSLLKTPVRNSAFKWAGQTYKTEAFLIGLKGRTDIKLNTLNDAKDYSVGTIRGYYSETFLRQVGFKEHQNLSLSVKYTHMWQMLFKGRIDFVLTNFIALDREIASAGLDANNVEQYLSVLHFPDELHIATGLKTSDKVVNQLRMALIEIKANGRYQQIIDRWSL